MDFWSHDLILCYFDPTYKIYAKSLNPGRSWPMAIFPKSKMAAAAMLFLQKMMIFATLSTTGCHSAPAYKI